VVEPSTGPRIRVEKNSVLPKRRRGGAPADISVLRKDLAQELDLKRIGFLESDEIRTIPIKKRKEALLSDFPAVFAIVGQAESEVEGHDGKIDGRVFHERRFLSTISYS